MTMSEERKRDSGVVMAVDAPIAGRRADHAKTVVVKDVINTDWRAAATATIALLAARFPACFALDHRRRRPLKIGIYEELRAALGDDIDQPALRTALRHYTAAPGYLRSLTEGAARLGLDGAPAGTVGADQAARATRELSWHQRQRTAAKPAKTTKSTKIAKPTKQTMMPMTASAPPQAKRIGLAELRAAAAARKAVQLC
jgi:ProP effector